MRRSRGESAAQEAMMAQSNRFPTSCGSCPLSGRAIHGAVGGEGGLERREFLREAVGRALATIGALSLLPAEGVAMPFASITGSGVRTAKAYPIPASDGVSIDKEESVIIARASDRVFAFSLACPHQNTALRWEERNNRFQCPKHKSRYRPDGVFIEGRATRGMDRFAVSRDGTAPRLLVNLDVLYRQDHHPRQWEAAFVQLNAGEK